MKTAPAVSKTEAPKMESPKAAPWIPSAEGMEKPTIRLKWRATCPDFYQAQRPDGVGRHDAGDLHLPSLQRCPAVSQDHSLDPTHLQYPDFPMDIPGDSDPPSRPPPPSPPPRPAGGVPRLTSKIRSIALRIYTVRRLPFRVPRELFLRTRLPLVTGRSTPPNHPAHRPPPLSRGRTSILFRVMQSTVRLLPATSVVT